MKNNNLVLPIYCPNCDNLTYICKTNERSQIIEFKAEVWQVHPCALINQEAIWKEQVVAERKQLRWGLDRLPFSPRTAQRALKSKKTNFGVVLSIYEMEGFCNLRVFSSDQALIDVKVTIPKSQLSAGMLLDLSSLSRIGKGKYRLSVLKELVLPNPVAPLSSLPSTYLELNLKTKDQRLLETFSKRFIQFFLEKGTSAFCIAPLPIASIEKDVYYSRSIYFIPIVGLTGSFKDISIPDSVEVSLQEIKSVSSSLH